MKRVFWAALGAAVGVLVLRIVRRRAAQLTPSAVSESAGGAVAAAAAAVRRLAEEIRVAAAERESELISALDLPDPAGAEPAGAGNAPSRPAAAPAHRGTPQRP